MPLAYDGKKIIPAPLVTLNKTYRGTGDGDRVGTLWNIQLNGTLVPFRGSPSGDYADIDDAFWTAGGFPPDEAVMGDNEDFNQILRKQEAVRSLFGTDGRSLEWQPASGQPVVKCNPRVKSVSFVEGVWATRSDYTIDLEADWIFIAGGGDVEDGILSSGLIRSAEEEWRFDEVAGHDGSDYEVGHIVSAQGVRGFDDTGALLGGREAWEHAKSWVDARTTSSVDAQAMFAAVGSSGWIGGSRTVSTNIAKKDGSYAVTETFRMMPDDTFTEKDFSVSFRSDDDDPEVRYEGRVFAIVAGGRAGGVAAAARARNAVPTDAAARAEASARIGTLLGGKTIPVAPDEKTVGVSDRDGSATFSFRWGTGDDQTFSRTQEASVSFDANTNTYTLEFTVGIEGKGPDAATRLANAKAAIPTTASARLTALSIVGDEIPSGVTIGSAVRSRSSAFNQTAGTVRVSWRWDSNSENNTVITVQETQPREVFAEILIPGRAAGPIQQDMSTQTSKVVTVSLRGSFDARPSNASTEDDMNDALGIPESQWFLERDDISYTAVTGQYSRTRTHRVRNG